MATDISSMAVKLTANASGFNLKGPAREVEGFADRLAGAGSRIQSFAMGLAGLGAGLLGGLSLGRGLSLAADMEDTQTRMAILLGDAKKVDGVLSSLKDYAGKTSFALPDLTSAATGLIATGSATKTLGAEIRMLGDVSQGANIPLAELAAVYGKMRTGKFIQAEELNQLVGRGLPVYAEFAKILGVSTEAVKGLGSDGKITFDVLQQAFVNLTAQGGQYANIATKVGENTNGAFAQVKDAADRALEGIGAALTRELNVKGGMKELAAWVEDFGKKAAWVTAETVRWVREHSDGLKTFMKVAASAASAVGMYRVALYSVIAAQKAWAAGQAIVLAMQGPKGWATLAGAALAAGGAYLAINHAFSGIEQTATAAAMGTTALADAQTKAERAALENQATQDMAVGKQNALAKSIGDVSKKLEEQIATFGMSSREIDVWRLKQQGATDEMLAGIAEQGAALATLERLNNQKKDTPGAGRADTVDKLNAMERRFTAGFTIDNAGPIAKVQRATERTAKASEQIAKNTRPAAGGQANAAYNIPPA